MNAHGGAPEPAHDQPCDPEEARIARRQDAHRPPRAVLSGDALHDRVERSGQLDPLGAAGGEVSKVAG